MPEKTTRPNVDRIRRMATAAARDAASALTIATRLSQAVEDVVEIIAAMTARPTVTGGELAITGSLAGAGTRDVTVPLDTPQATTTYRATATVIGGTGLVGELRVERIVSRSKAAVVVRVRNGGLVSVATSGAVVAVTAISAP